MGDELWYKIQRHRAEFDSMFFSASNYINPKASDYTECMGAVTPRSQA
jgi:hypothetical protein